MMMHQHKYADDNSAGSEAQSEEDDDVFPPTLSEIKDTYPTRTQLATAQEYERRIRKLEQINETLRQNVSALYAEANERHERPAPPIPPRGGTTHMELSRDEAYETSIIPYNEDPSSIETQRIHQIDKLQKMNAKLRWKLVRQKMLVSQLSANLKVASEKIEDLTTQQPSSENALILHPDLHPQSTISSIRQDQIQDVSCGLQAILQLISQNSSRHKRDTSKLLEVDMAMHRREMNEETVSEKVQRVIRQLRGEEERQVVSDTERNTSCEMNEVVPAVEEHTREDNKSDSAIAGKETREKETAVKDSDEASDVSSIDSWHKDKDRVGRTTILEMADENNNVVASAEIRSDTDDHSDISSIDSWHKDRDRVGRTTVLEMADEDANDCSASVEYDDKSKELPSEDFNTAQQCASPVRSVQSDGSKHSELENEAIQSDHVNTSQCMEGSKEIRAKDLRDSEDDIAKPRSSELVGDSSKDQTIVFEDNRDKVGEQSSLDVSAIEKRTPFRRRKPAKQKPALCESHITVQSDYINLINQTQMPNVESDDDESISSSNGSNSDRAGSRQKDRRKSSTTTHITVESGCINLINQTHMPGTKSDDSESASDRAGPQDNEKRKQARRASYVTVQSDYSNLVNLTNIPIAESVDNQSVSSSIGSNFDRVESHEDDENLTMKSPSGILAETLRAMDGDISKFGVQFQKRTSTWGIDSEDNGDGTTGQLVKLDDASDDSFSVQSWHKAKRPMSLSDDNGDGTNGKPIESDRSSASSSVESYHKPNQTMNPQDRQENVETASRSIDGTNTDALNELYPNVDTISQHQTNTKGVDNDSDNSDTHDWSAHRKDIPISVTTQEKQSEYIPSNDKVNDEVGSKASRGKFDSPEKENPKVFEYSISDLVPSKASPGEVEANDTGDEVKRDVPQTVTTMHIKHSATKESTTSPAAKSRGSKLQSKIRNNTHEASTNSLSVNSLKTWDEYAMRNRKTILSASKAKTPQSGELSDDPLSARLKRRQLFQQRQEVVPCLENNERRQFCVLVRAVNGIDFVPPNLPPPPPSNQSAQQYKKGLPDGFYKYKSSSGNEYVGYWKNSKRHGFGTAKYKDGECYCGQWNQGKRDGVGTLYLSNSEVFDGNWSFNRKNGIGTYFWADGDVDVSRYEQDVRLESIRWTKDRSHAYSLNLKSAKKKEIKLSDASQIVRGWEADQLRALATSSKA